MNNKLFLTGFASEIAEFGVRKEAASPPADIEELERAVERQKRQISEQVEKNRRISDWLARAGLLAGLSGGALYAWKTRGADIQAMQRWTRRYLEKKLPKVYQEIAEKYTGKSFPKTSAAEDIEERRKALLRKLRTPRQLAAQQKVREEIAKVDRIVMPLVTSALGAFAGVKVTRLFNVLREMAKARAIVKKFREETERRFLSALKKTKEDAPNVVQPKPRGTSRFPKRWLSDGEEQLS